MGVAQFLLLTIACAIAATRCPARMRWPAGMRSATVLLALVPWFYADWKKRSGSTGSTSSFPMRLT